MDEKAPQRGERFEEEPRVAGSFTSGLTFYSQVTLPVELARVSYVLMSH